MHPWHHFAANALLLVQDRIVPASDWGQHLRDLKAMEYHRHQKNMGIFLENLGITVELKDMMV